MATQNPHLIAEQLAALVEGGLGEIDSGPLEEHLLHCRECMAAYADVIRLRHEWMRSPGSRAADADLRERGYGLFPVIARPAKGDDPAARPRHLPSRRRREPRRWLVAAVVPLALLLGTGWFALRGHDGRDDLGPALAVVVAAVDEASHHGMLLPGSGAANWAPAATFRAPGRADPGLATALTELAGRPDDGAARLLRAEGLVASGSLDLARLLTDTARRDLPADTSWQVLAAVVAFRENDLVGAEALLHGVLAVEPTNIEALFNLGLVFAAGDRTEEARRIFRSVGADADHPLASRRALLELARMED